MSEHNPFLHARGDHSNHDADMACFATKHEAQKVADMLVVDGWYAHPLRIDYGWQHWGVTAGLTKNAADQGYLRTDGEVR